MNRGHKHLDVWRESAALATHLYQVTEKFPKTEIYGLTSQMRRSVVSIPSNIAEGAARVPVSLSFQPLFPLTFQEN